MSTQTYLILNAGHARRLVSMLGQLTYERGWKVTVERLNAHRTIEQNAVIRGLVRQIAEFTGDDPDRMHEILLARRFGTERIDLGGGQTMDRPARRSSDLDHGEARDYMRWLEAFAASELGLTLA